MSIASHLNLVTDKSADALDRKVIRDSSPRPPIHERPTLTVVDDGLALADPSVTPSPAWDDAMAQVVSWMNVKIQSPQNRASVLKQRVKWPWGVQAGPASPVFMPWLSHACTAFQDPRSQREASPARWVASYLWEPFGSSHAVKGSVADVMLISPHPAACRLDEESCASIPGIGLLREMIAAAQAQNRSRIALVGYERSQNVTARQLLSAKSRLPLAELALEVLTIENALARLASDPASWDAIIVLPELRSLIFALLARLSEVAGPWPMVWHGEGLALVCGETASPTASNGPLDAALLIQALSLVAHNGGKTSAARRLAEAWARLRDRGLVTPTRGSPAPYCKEMCDAALLEELCRQANPSGRPVPMWKALSSISAGIGTEETRPTRPQLVADN